MVPIKLLDGKVIQKEPEESMQIKAEFTNFTHQEFNDDKRKLHASPIHDRSLADSSHSDANLSKMSKNSKFL